MRSGGRRAPRVRSWCAAVNQRWISGRCGARRPPRRSAWPWCRSRGRRRARARRRSRRCSARACRCRRRRRRSRPCRGRGRRAGRTDGRCRVGGDGAVDGVGDDRALGQGEHRVLLGDVDHLARTAALDVAQRGERADGRVERGRQVADDGADPDRRAAGEAVHRPQAAGGLRAVVVRGRGGRAGLAEAGNARCRSGAGSTACSSPSPGPACPWSRPGSSRAGRRPGAPSRAAGPCPRGGTGRGWRRACAGCTGRRRRCTLAVGDAQARGEVARVVGVARMLDLDHRRAEVREHHRAKRSGDDAGQVEDRDAGAAGGGRLSSLRAVRLSISILPLSCAAPRGLTSRRAPASRRPARAGRSPRTARRRRTRTASRRRRGQRGGDRIAQIGACLVALDAGDGARLRRGPRGAASAPISSRREEVVAEAPVAVERGVCECAFQPGVMALHPAERPCRGARVHHGVAHLARYLGCRDGAWYRATSLST